MISSKDITEGHINLVDHETFKKIVRDVLRDVGSVRSTLGPGGKANLVHDQNNMSLYKSGYFFKAVSVSQNITPKSSNSFKLLW